MVVPNRKLVLSLALGEFLMVHLIKVMACCMIYGTFRLEKQICRITSKVETVESKTNRWHQSGSVHLLYCLCLKTCANLEEE